MHHQTSAFPAHDELKVRSIGSSHYIDIGPSSLYAPPPLCLMFTSYDDLAGWVDRLHRAVTDAAPGPDGSEVGEWLDTENARGRAEEAA